jgi:hypothetical protein
MGAYEEYQATGDEDGLYCWKCEVGLTPETVRVLESDHHSETSNLCESCYDAAHDGPSDDDLSEFYGGGGVRPMSEQYREAAKAKKESE